MRKLALFILLILPALGFAQKDWSKVQVRASKVSGNVYMLQGSGGNMAALVGEDGVLLVDTQFAPLAEKIRASLKGLGADKPVRFVVNTHYHGDHIGGNAAFAETATLIAQTNVRKRLQNGGTSGNGGSIHSEVKVAERAAMPVIAFERDTTLHLDGEDVQVWHTPAAHTDGDAIIFFPKANVVHMGDDFVRYGFPYVDIEAGGSVQGMITAMENAIAQLPPDVKVIPGHGQLSSMDDVREYLKMLKETSAVVQQGLKAGKTLEQMKQEKVLAPWQKWSNDFISADAFLETLYNSRH